MIDQLDQILRRLLAESGAEAAVVWVRRDGPGDGASVIACCPQGLVEPGADWPAAHDVVTDVVRRDPAELAGAAPGALLSRLRRPPTASQTLGLGGGGLFLLVVWGDPPTAAGVPEALRGVIANELGYVARLVDSSRFNHGEAERLLAVINALAEGVVSVDPHRGQANVNLAAARFLDLPPGQLSMSHFASAMARLAEGAVNRGEIAEPLREPRDNPEATVDCVLRFAREPTHLRVRSSPARRGAFAGRVWVLADESALSEALESSERARGLLRASSDAMLDPQTLVEAVTDPAGEVVDLVFRDVNAAFCDYIDTPRGELLDRSMLAIFPNVVGSGLMSRYARCAVTGEPVALDDFEYLTEIIDQPRRYDIRAARVRPGLITITLRDTTGRFEEARRLAASEEQFRLLALNSTDAVIHVRDRVAVWVSPAIEDVLGAPPERWVGTEIRQVVPPEDVPAFLRRWETLEAGGAVKERIRVNAADGVTHWVHLHAKPFYDSRGRRDGTAVALRLIDDEVAAEGRLAAAQEQRARADALYRRLVENSAVGMCLASPEGPLVEVNRAMCEFFGYDNQTLLAKTWMELTAPEYLDADLANVADMVAGRIDAYQMVKQFVHADGRRIWGHLSVGCLRRGDGSVEMSIGQIVDITAEVTAREQLRRAAESLAASTEQYRLIAENVADVVIHGHAGKFAWVSPSAKDLLGAPAEYWVGRDLAEIIPPEDRPAFAERLAVLEAGGSLQRRSRVISRDGATHWVHLRAAPFYGADGAQRGFTSALRIIDAEVESENAAAEARRERARADELYRRSMDSAAVGMCLTEPDGRFIKVNPALCAFFGYDAEALLGKTWQEITAPEFLDADLARVEEMLAGRLESYRTLKQFVHADGRLIWGDLSVGCTRDGLGRVERFVAQIVDVTATVAANARNAQLTERLTEDLRSAASYMASIMPRGLTWPVSVSSRYLPSQELGGDCFDYAWIDDDHLMVYLIDVSGHGIEPALLAVSLQNMLRSGALSAAILIRPDAVLAQLNRMFQMESQGDHFFTVWYGVYDRAARTVSYSSAGAPPALLFDPRSATPIALNTRSQPIGVFDDTLYESASHPVPPGCRILVFSDGASELTLGDGAQLRLADFQKLVTRVAGSPDWTLDDLLGELRGLTADGVFEDDVSVIRLAFD